MIFNNKKYKVGTLDNHKRGMWESVVLDECKKMYKWSDILKGLQAEDRKAAIDAYIRHGITYPYLIKTRAENSYNAAQFLICLLTEIEPEEITPENYQEIYKDLVIELTDPGLAFIIEKEKHESK